MSRLIFIVSQAVLVHGATSQDKLVTVTEGGYFPRVSSGCDGVFLCDGCVDENFKERCLASLARTGDKNRGGKRTGSTTELWKNAFDWATMRKYWIHTPSALLSSLD